MYLHAILRLASIHKREGDLDSAITLWEEAAHALHLESHLELAKYYEHRQRDYSQAIYWTQSAIDLLDNPVYTNYQRRIWLQELEHRLDRLNKKRSAHG